jgi:hypothetical protein
MVSLPKDRSEHAVKVFLPLPLPNQTTSCSIRIARLDESPNKATGLRSTFIFPSSLIPSEVSMSSMFSITSTLPSHLAIEMSIELRVAVEILGAEILSASILGMSILGGLSTLFSTAFGAFSYQGIQHILCDGNLCDGRSPNYGNLRPDWTTVERKHHHPRSTRDGFTPALA